MNVREKAVMKIYIFIYLLVYETTAKNNHQPFQLLYINIFSISFNIIHCLCPDLYCLYPVYLL